MHVDGYLRTCSRLGFDVIEVASGFITITDDEFADLVRQVRSVGLAAVAEVGIQRGAGGGSAVEVLEREGTIDPELAVRRALRAHASRFRFGPAWRRCRTQEGSKGIRNLPAGNRRS